MLDRITILYPLLLLVAIATPCAAQDGLLNRGDKYYEAFSYTMAIESYEQAFRKDASSIPHARRLADCYWTLRDTRNAERWYAIVAASSQAEPQDIYRYAELLRISHQFADSDLWMKRFAKLAPNDSRVFHKENASEKLGELLGSEPITHKVSLVDFNSDHADLCPFIKDDRIIFASSRIDHYTSKHLHSWNDQPFLNLYSGKVAADGTVTGIAPMGDDLNTRYHESNAVISSDGTELYFTRNNYLEGRKVLSDEGVNNLQIFVRQKTATGWSKEVPFAFNSPSFSTGHPALSKDGRRIFFTSDMPGGKGGKDIYVCYRNEEGTWGEPQNLGDNVNTEGDEMFPYVHENVLYFASDGLLGLGGLDLFRVIIRGKGFGLPENLNAPINSSSDDLGLCLDEPGNIGFLTSDRDGALGTENIYWFRMHSKADDQRLWSGRVLDVVDAQPIPYLPVRLLDKDRKELAKTVTAANGMFEFPAPPAGAIVSARIPGGAQTEISSDEFMPSLFGDTEIPDLFLNSMMDLPVNAIVRDGNTGEWLDAVGVTVKDTRDGAVLFMGTTNEMGIAQGQIPDRRFGDDLNIEVQFSRPGYFSKTALVDMRVLGFLEQALTGTKGEGMTPVNTGIDMATAMNLKPIYFDYREARIRPDAAAELDRVAEVMKEDPSIRVDLRSHTDSRASTEYNDALSQRRADSTRAYLIAQGIAPSRITAKGFGERNLLNGCTDGVECSEEEHQLNRRTEFIVVNCAGCGTYMISGAQ